MNTFLKSFATIIGLFAVVGLILPNQIDIKRQIVIDAPIETVHQQVNNLENWPKWSPWTKLDPSIKTTLGDIHSGAGASQSWVGSSGSGHLTFIESSLSGGVVYKMTFDGDSTVYKAGFSYQQQGENTQVTWFMTGKMEPIIIGNYFALLMDSLIGDSFVQGLELLKTVSERASTD